MAEFDPWATVPTVQAKTAATEIVETINNLYDIASRAQGEAAMSFFGIMGLCSDAALYDHLSRTGVAINRILSELCGKIVEAELDANSSLKKIADDANALSSGFSFRLIELEGEKLTLSRKLGEVEVHPIHVPETRDQVWAMTGGRCYYCDIDLVRDVTAEDKSCQFHVDHIVAKNHCGPDHLANYVPSCRRCNTQKGTKSFVEFLRFRSVEEQKNEEPF